MRRQRTRRVAAVAVAACAVGASGVACPLFSFPADPAIWAGCWRFAVRMATADGVRSFVDRDFIVQIDPSGALAGVIMRRQGESIANPLDPTARYVDLISATAATTLQSSLYATRISTDPANPSVRYDGVISASTTGFIMNASLSLPAFAAPRYALNATVTISGNQVTSVTGEFIDQADERGVLQIQQLFTGAGRVASLVSCPSPIEPVCDRFHEIGSALTSTRFTAVDPGVGLGGQVCFGSGSSIDAADLATGGRTFRTALNSVVQGRMAVDVTRRRLYAATRNAAGNNALAVIDLDNGALLRTVELKVAGCIDFGTRGAAAVIPSTGEVLVTLANPSDSRFDGVARVEPVSGVVNGALQNVDLQVAAFTRPGDMVVMESRGIALVANTGAAELTVVPLASINREIRGGDGAACQDATTSGMLNEAVTGGAAVVAIAVDEADARGVVLVQGAAEADGAFQVFTVSGSGAAATVALGGSTPLGRRAVPFGLDIDVIRNQAFAANGNLDTILIALPGGAAVTFNSIATGDITGVASVPGRNRLIQAGTNSFLGEYCLP